STAMRVSNIISAIDDDESQKTRKINTLLQNQNTVSNGYVGLGPFRSEFYLTPPQNSFSLGSLPWADQLTIHEYRHAVQYNQFNIGISKVMRTIFGEHGQALANSAAVPDWFFEGDAVYAETNFSKQGRGSLPYFYKEYRALWNANKNYSWMKLRNGSLKDAIPNHYPTGFMLVAYGYEKYGNDFWKNVTTDAASFKKLFYPFQQAIKKHSGQDFTSFRKDAFDFFKQQFKQDDKERTLIYESFRDEQYPVFTEDGRLIYVESSYKKTPRLVMQTATGTKTIRKLDNIIEPYFSYNKGKIVYASYQPDVRWGYKTYNNIVMADATNGHQHTITKKTKYFSPALSGDGKMIVAVNVPPSGKNSLHLLDAENGTIIDSIKNPEQLFYTYPKLHIDHILSPVRNHEGKMSL